MNNFSEVREARLEDLPAVVDIYNFEVVHGLSNYETLPRSLEQQQKWWTALREQGYPVLVVARQRIRDGGCAHLGPRDRCQHRDLLSGAWCLPQAVAARRW